jgi:short subunit dehydrogenase-like uncharacterized protein
LSARLPEQAEWRLQHKQQQQQQRLPKGQLPPDQQAELYNSLNRLVLLRLWLLGCAAADQLAQPAMGGDVVNAGIVLGSMRCSKQHVCVAQHVELILLCWPRPDASRSVADAPTGSSSSSSSIDHSRKTEPVRYGKLVLPWLPQVTYGAALRVVLAAAHTLACFTDSVQQLQTANIQPLQLDPGNDDAAECAREVRQAVQDASSDMTDRSVLALQLLLLACQAKVHWYDVAWKQDRRSLVRNLAPSGFQQPQQQQQQQQQQQRAAGKPAYLVLQDHHDLLLSTYRCKDADMTLILGQQQEGLPQTT